MKKKLFANILLVCGILLVLGAMGIFLNMQCTQKKADRQIGGYVEQLKESMPEITDAFAEERQDVSMSMMEIDGNDFVGILEVPFCGIEFPIGSSWEKKQLIQYPCRYWGSAYDGSLVIGGSDRKGQFDFMDEISIGDCIYFTDMTGAKYSYVVSWVERVKEVPTQYLENENVGLTIFVRNQYGFDYTVVRCE